jgi:hypothetical protein
MDYYDIGLATEVSYLLESNLLFDNLIKKVQTHSLKTLIQELSFISSIEQGIPNLISFLNSINQTKFENDHQRVNLLGISYDDAQNSIQEANKPTNIQISKHNDLDQPSIVQHIRNKLKGIKLPPKKLAIKAHWIYLRKVIFNELFDGIPKNTAKKLRVNFNINNQLYSKLAINTFLESKICNIYDDIFAEASNIPSEENLVRIDSRRQVRIGEFILEDDEKKFLAYHKLNLNSYLLQMTAKEFYYKYDVFETFKDHIKSKDNMKDVKKFLSVNFLELLELLKQRNKSNNRYLNRKRLNLTANDTNQQINSYFSPSDRFTQKDGSIAEKDNEYKLSTRSGHEPLKN